MAFTGRLMAVKESATHAHHALFWMVAANGVGLLAAVLLLWPPLNQLLGPFTYGRMLPLHLNFHLYGWVSFPLIGLLFHLYGVAPTSRSGRFTLALWSVSLLFGGLYWLGGHTSGKLFLDWQGPPRLLFTLALAWLWLTLAITWFRRYRTQSRRSRLLGALFLTLLLPVPFLMYASADASIYPAVNPHSGGATGSSLLGSTLGMIVLFLITPLITSKPRQKDATHRRLLFLLLICHGLFFGLVDHGNVSHHDFSQILALGTLLPWVPVLIAYYRGFIWSNHSRVWLLGFGFWAGLLTLNGWLSFLPGILEGWKFTNAMVAHAHLAMAGMVSSFLMILLLALNPRLTILGRSLPALIWQAGCLSHVTVLLVFGNGENLSPSILFHRENLAQLAYAGRLLAGLAMFLVSVYWLVGSMPRSARNLEVLS